MQKVGVQAVFDTSGFDSGLSRYLVGTVTANTASERLASGMTTSGQRMSIVGQVVSKVGQVFASVGMIISKFISFLSSLIKTLAIAAAAITTIAFATGKLDKLLLFIAQATSKIPTLSNLFRKLAADYQSVGGSAGATDAFSKRVGALAGAGGNILKVVTVVNLLKTALGLTQPSADAASKGILKLGSASAQAGTSISSLSVGLAAGLGGALGSLATGALNTVLGMFTNLTGKIKEFVMASVMGSARTVEMASVLGMLGAKQGITTDEIAKSTKAIRALGIEQSVAQNAVMQSIRYNISLADTEKLANVARNAAVVGMTNTSDALDRINWGIQTNQVEILRGVGLNIMSDDAMRKYAASINKTTQELTAAERIQGMVNAVIEEGTKIDGAYVTAQKEAGKELRSFARYIDDIQIAMGAPLQGVFSNIVFSLSNLLKTVSSLLTTEGPIKDMLYNIGALASIATEPILNLSKAIYASLLPATKDMEGGTKFALKNMTTTAEGEGRSFVATLMTNFSNAAEGALRWGVNIVTELADGMIQGAAAALTAAMNFIGNLLSSWLSAASPPRVAPNIDKWGAAAANEWLHGFKDADFSLLESIQSPLKSVLDLVGKSADYASISMMLMESISSTGEVSGAVYDRLIALGGVYGKELADLTKLQSDYAKVTKEITAAQTKYYTQQTKVSTLTSEYNKMLRAGASKEALKAKLVEIQVAEKARNQAGKDAAAAAEKATALKSQMDLQSKILNQLMSLAKAQEQLAAPKENIADAIKDALRGAGGKIEMPDIKMPGMGGIDFNKPIDKALEKAKTLISEKLKDVFKPLVARWETSMKPALDKLASKFTWFSDIIKKSFAAIGKEAQPVIDWLKKIIPPDLLNDIGKVVGVIAVFAAGLLVLKGVLVVVGAVIALLTSPIALVIGAIALLTAAWTGNWGGIRDTLTKIWTETIYPTLQNIWKWLSINVPAAIKTVSDFWNNKLMPALRDVHSFIDRNVVPIFTALANVADAVLGKASDVLAGIWQNFILPALKDVWNIIDKNIMPIFRTMWDFMEKNVNPILLVLGTIILKDIRDAFEDIGKFIGGVVDGLNKFADAIRNAQLPEWLRRKSPSELEQALSGSGESADTAAISLDTMFMALGNVATVLETRLNVYAAALIEDFLKLQLIAAKSGDSIAAPISVALFRVRDAAAEAGSAVGGVWEGLLGIQSMNGMVSTSTVIIHEITYHEDREGPPGATPAGSNPSPVPTGGGGGGTSTAYQHGGWAVAGLARLHDEEFVISKAMRAGSQAIPSDVFSNAALSRLAGQKPQIIEVVRDVTVSFPNANIASDMDLNVINARVRRVVRDEMRRR